MKKIILTIFVIFIGCMSFASDYQQFKLDNGQTVIIKEVKENPIVIIDTWIKTGSINETDKNNGVAHFLEHMFFKGTKNFPAGEFDKILEAKGAITNAGTSKDFTHYYITIPSKDFEKALEMHADMLLNPMIPRKELEKERKVVLEEISKNEDNPQSILYKNLNKQLFREHPYKREVIGTRDVINTITREELLDFYNSYYYPANMTTIIIGDVDTQTVLNKVNELFGEKIVKAQLPKYKKEKPLLSSSEIIAQADVDTAYLMLGFRGVDAKNKKENYILDVLATILGDGTTSRLYKNVKDKQRLVQSIYASNISNRDDGIFVIGADFKPENIDKVKRAILDEIEFIQKNPPSQDELEKAFSIMERDTYYSRESISNISSELGYFKTVFGDLDIYDNYISEIKKVTSKDIQNIARKILDTNKMAISLVVPKTYQKEVKQDCEKPVNLLKKETKLVSENDKIKKYLLPNETTLLINQNDTNDIIAIKIFAKGGSIIEDKPGVSLVVAEAMQSGTKKYTKDEFSKLLEENGIRLDISNSTESFNISVKTTKNELDLSMDLLNEILNNALFDDYEVDKIKADAVYDIRTNRDRPFNVALEEFREYIYGNSPYSKSTTKKMEKSIPAITKSDLLNYYSKIFNPNNIVVSINGNISDEQVKEMMLFFEKSLNPDLTSKFDYSTLKGSVPKLNTNKNITVNKETQAAWIALGWQTCGFENEKDYITLQVINSVLGTGMSSRLFKNLRDKQGLAYQIGSVYSPNTNVGFFLTYIGTSPEKAEHSKAEILREIEVLKKEFITIKELQDAKDKLIGNYILSQETNSEKASSLGWFEVTDRGYNFDKRYPDLIQAVTPSDINLVANKYFSTPYVYVIVTPNMSKRGM